MAAHQRLDFLLEPVGEQGFIGPDRAYRVDRQVQA